MDGSGLVSLAFPGALLSLTIMSIGVVLEKDMLHLWVKSCLAMGVVLVVVPAVFRKLASALGNKKNNCRKAGEQAWQFFVHSGMTWFAYPVVGCSYWEDTRKLWDQEPHPLDVHVTYLYVVRLAPYFPRPVAALHLPFPTVDDLSFRSCRHTDPISCVACYGLSAPRVSKGPA